MSEVDIDIVEEVKVYCTKLLKKGDCKDLPFRNLKHT